MIRKGKKAKVSCCKEASCSQPIQAELRRAKKGSARDVVRTAKPVVSPAFMKIGVKKCREQKPERVLTSKPQILPVVAGRTICSAEKPPKILEGKAQRVDKDITLKKLFDSEAERR